MKIKSVPPFCASISIGLQKGYAGELFTKQDLMNAVQEFQGGLIESKEIYLSASISECEIVLNRYSEPHIKIDFINYPRFPLDEETFKMETKNIALFLMDKFGQNRIVIVYHDEHLMLEKSEDVGRGVKK